MQGHSEDLGSMLSERHRESRSGGDKETCYEVSIIKMELIEYFQGHSFVDASAFIQKANSEPSLMQQYTLGLNRVG